MRSQERSPTSRRRSAAEAARPSASSHGWSLRSRQVDDRCCWNKSPSCATSGSSNCVCPTFHRLFRAEYRRLLDRRDLASLGLDTGSPTPYIGARRPVLAAPSIWFGDRRARSRPTVSSGSPHDSPTRVEPRDSWGWITTNPVVAATPPGLRRQLAIPSPADSRPTHRRSRVGEPSAAGVHPIGGSERWTTDPSLRSTCTRRRDLLPHAQTIGLTGRGGCRRSSTFQLALGGRTRYRSTIVDFPAPSSPKISADNGGPFLVKSRARVVGLPRKASQENPTQRGTLESDVSYATGSVDAAGGICATLCQRFCCASSPVCPRWGLRPVGHPLTASLPRPGSSIRTSSFESPTVGCQKMSSSGSSPTIRTASSRQERRDPSSTGDLEDRGGSSPSGLLAPGVRPSPTGDSRAEAIPTLTTSLCGPIVGWSNPSAVLSAIKKHSQRRCCVLSYSAPLARAPHGSFVAAPPFVDETRVWFDRLSPRGHATRATNGLSGPCDGSQCRQGSVIRKRVGHCSAGPGVPLTHGSTCLCTGCAR